MSTLPITVVTGLPRSGTSMMMQMIEAGGMAPLTDGVRAADDDNPRGYYEFEMVKAIKQQPTWLAEATGKVVKMVCLLLPELPESYRYQVLFMRRNMDQILMSQKKMLDRQQRTGANLSPQQLARVFAGQLEKIESWLSQQGNITVLHVDYNRMMANAPPQIEQINQFLGGHLNTLAMASVIDPALYRNRGVDER